LLITGNQINGLTDAAKRSEIKNSNET